METFRTKINENGRIVIPAVVREKLDLKIGEEIIIKIVGEELHITSVKQTLKNLQRRVRKYTKGKSLVEELKAMRREEFKIENQ